MILSALVDLSRLQFALTAMFHWIFVPLTLGLGFIVAFMETAYFKTGNEFWKRTTKFWMKIFAINFAIGVATGIILEFEFGTNWSNYSWFVGDIFGAPLAIEGILAFFMESTFFAVMFFGWDKVSRQFHLAATWLTAIGANLSALWILVANAWMQHPTGMEFNPDTARNEMVDFFAVIFSPVALNKFFHTVLSGFMLASVVVIGISAWYLLKGREEEFSRKSIKIAAVFGLLSSLLVAYTGDGSAYQVAQKQPMKLAAMEGLYEGRSGAPLVIAGVLNPQKNPANRSSDSLRYFTEKPFIFQFSAPKVLSYLSNRDFNSFVPGIENIIKGGYPVKTNGKDTLALSIEERMLRGRIAINSLSEYHKAKEAGDEEGQNLALNDLKANFEHFGYGYLKSPEEAVPNVPLTFYSFHLMVLLGGYFILFFVIALLLETKSKIAKHRWFLILSIISIPLVYICSQAGWIVAEVGRQPWTIQDLLPVSAAVSGVGPNAVRTTIILFFTMFSVLLAAELTIMFKQIKKGPGA